jgi:hypothetical protein
VTRPRDRPPRSSRIFAAFQTFVRIGFEYRAEGKIRINSGSRLSPKVGLP